MNKKDTEMKKPKSLFKKSSDGVMEISDEAAGAVAGGIVLEDSKKMFFDVFNATGMGAVKKRVSWGGNTGLTREEALDKANNLDQIDYSKL